MRPVTILLPANDGRSGICSKFWGERGLSLSKAVGFDRLNQLRRNLLRRLLIRAKWTGLQNI
jgi:hypothetical protein